ncbi:hypothetical protein MC885_000254 [Smutsia gigantea]|nr:hypothetical protein MC885_000254 [Smutsia gigantea]
MRALSLLLVFRQLNTAIAVSQMSSGQCRLAPLIQVIQDCSHLYHYTVKLMFKLHACESPALPPPPGSLTLLFLVRRSRAGPPPPQGSPLMGWVEPSQMASDGF